MGALGAYPGLRNLADPGSRIPNAPVIVSGSTLRLPDVRDAGQLPRLIRNPSAESVKGVPCYSCFPS